MPAYTLRTIGIFGKNIATIPKRMNTKRMTKRYEPIPVKSHLVWNANRVKPRQITAVIPTASRTESALRNVKFTSIKKRI